MPCYYPIRGYRSRNVNRETGKRPIVFKRSEGFVDLSLEVPCGRCIGCRLERSRKWAARCMLESELYDHNCFVTLTYDDKNIPDQSRCYSACETAKRNHGYCGKGSLCKADFQKFMKRLRRRYNKEIRYFMCGEYGRKKLRPHYHVILFDFDFAIKKLWSYDKKTGSVLYRSEALEKLWPFGFSTIGEVTFESAAYVARYILKKVTGDDAKKHYGQKTPEYCNMSRRPGIASDWLDKFKDDVYPDDSLIVRGDVRMKPPRYFDNKLEQSDPEALEKIKYARKKAARENPHNSPERREEIDGIKKRKVKRLKRSIEDDCQDLRGV